MDGSGRRAQLDRIYNDQIGLPFQKLQHVNSTHAAELQAGTTIGQPAVHFETGGIIGHKFVADTDDYCTAM